MEMQRRTQSAMDHPPPPYHERRGPHIYVHVELGVEWPTRNDQHRSYQVAFRSRNARERMPPVSQQTQAPIADHLVAIHDFQMRQQQLRDRRRQHNIRRELVYHPQDQQQQQHYPPSPSRVTEVAPPREEGRQSRSGSRQSHERGRSAPPPFGSNTWDVNYSQTAATSARTAHRANTGEPQVWKALPHPPSQFRLGEADMPWSSWTFPFGYGPSAYPQDESGSSHGSVKSPDDAQRRRQQQQSVSRSEAETTLPDTAAGTVSPISSPRRSAWMPDQQGGDPSGRVRELGALSEAMMTVDNGFENQWWYQGPRTSTMSAEEARSLAAAAAAAADSSASGAAAANLFSASAPSPGPSPGWAMVSPTSAMTPLPTIAGPVSPPTTAVMTPLTHGGDERAVLGNIDDIPSLPVLNVVSPVTVASNLSDSPGPVYMQLQRSLSTRSEELFFTTPADQTSRSFYSAMPTSP